MLRALVTHLTLAARRGRDPGHGGGRRAPRPSHGQRRGRLHRRRRAGPAQPPDRRTVQRLARDIGVSPHLRRRQQGPRPLRRGSSSAAAPSELPVLGFLPFSNAVIEADLARHVALPRRPGDRGCRYRRHRQARERRGVTRAPAADTSSRVRRHYCVLLARLPTPSSECTWAPLVVLSGWSCTRGSRERRYRAGVAAARRDDGCLRSKPVPLLEAGMASGPARTSWRSAVSLDSLNQAACDPDSMYARIAELRNSARTPGVWSTASRSPDSYRGCQEGRHPWLGWLGHRRRPGRAPDDSTAAVPVHGRARIHDPRIRRRVDPRHRLVLLRQHRGDALRHSTKRSPR